MPPTMRASLPLLLLSLAASPAVPVAPSPRPPEPRPPEVLALPGYRLHLLVDEEVDPDRLGQLGRPGVVLWLRTRSNMLRSSIAERLGRFGEAYVRLRPPVLEAHAAQLRFAPRAGVWLEEGALGGAGVYRMGTRRLALTVTGPLTPERVERIRRARPAQLLWHPGEPPDLVAWSTFAQLPGAKLLSVEGAAVAPWEGCDALYPHGAARGLAVAVDLRGSAEAFTFPSGCRLGARVRVSPRISDAAIARILASNPSAELELEVGSDEEAVRAAVGLLDRLEAASATGRGLGPGVER
ncbi:MAG TPA: hypothetical protein VK447_19240 [Myxococcaceae bacterium]|nr:hypothetical protein [Myxococcaceae bacterium]